MATLWPLSLAASVFSVLGFVPEFRRLSAERCRGGAGWSLWVIWTSSFGLSLVNAVLNEAPPLVVSNSAVNFGLTAAAAVLNIALPPPPPPPPNRGDEELHRSETAANVDSPSASAAVSL